MNADQLGALKLQRVALSAQVQAMLDTPDDQRPTAKTKLRNWLKELDDSEKLLAELDALLMKLDRPAAVGKAAKQAVSVDDKQIAVLARIPKGKNAELRVTASEWRGRRVIDVRTFAMFKGESEMKPTRKGVMVDASKLGALIEALHLAQQHA